MGRVRILQVGMAINVAPFAVEKPSFRRPLLVIRMLPITHHLVLKGPNVCK